jgi:uncharacterized beta-barrel protein YwiB (DUF1934 family)
MQTSQTETLNRLALRLKNLNSARKRLEEKGKIKSIEITFEGESYENKDRAYIAAENILDFGSIKTQLIASLDERIEAVKKEMISLLQ